MKQLTAPIEHVFLDRMTQRNNHSQTTSLKAATASNDAARVALRLAPAIATIILVLVLITSLTSAGVGFV
jgi:hypothetical protein